MFIESDKVLHLMYTAIISKKIEREKIEKFDDYYSRIKN